MGLSIQKYLVSHNTAEDILLTMNPSLLVFAGLFSLALGQGGNNWFDAIRDQWNDRLKYDDVIDNIHEFRFEYHNLQGMGAPNILIAISDRRDSMECHIVEVPNDWEAQLQDEAALHRISEDLYKIITEGKVPETTLTMQQLTDRYKDPEATRECRGHTIKLLNYTPPTSR